MNVTAEDIIGLVTLLRSSNVADIQSADNQLQELIKQPNTIPALFALLDETSDEKIQIHAYFMLASCFRNLRSKIDDEFFLQCREKIIDLLQKETKTQCIEALVFVVQILNDASSPWPEIIQFAFSINYGESSINLFLALSIFNRIIYKLSSDIILENKEGLLDLALYGLKSDFQNHQTIIKAVTFLYNLYIEFNAETPNQIPDGSVFQERLLEIFSYSIDSSESNFFTKITKPIIIGYEEKIFIFPAVEAMPKILQVLQNDQLDAIFRLTVHNFFVNSFSNATYSNQLSEEDWKLLFNVENYITGLIVSSVDDDDDANNWFDDVFNGLSIFFLKMENKEAVSFTMKQGQDLLSDIDTSEPSSLPVICFSLLMFYACFYHYQEYFTDEEAESIYQVFIEAMNSHVKILMSLSGNCLLDLFENFEKIINAKYISKTLESILTYLDEVTKDDLLLYYFTKVLDNCDPIFCNLVDVCFQLINNGSSFAQYSAYFVIGQCIDHSSMVAYELFDQLYSQLINIIKSQEFIQMPHHLVLMDLTALINLSPEKIEKHLDEFLIPILTAFHNTKDQLLIQNILNVLESISNNKYLMKKFDPQYYELMVTDFPKLIQKDWRKKIEDSFDLDTQFQKVIQKFVNAAHSLEILAMFTVEYKQFVVEGEIMNFFQAFFQALKILVNHFNELDFKSIFNALTTIIGSNSFAERGDEKHKNELLLLKQQVDANPDESLVEQYEEKKMIYELYMQEIEACKSLYQDVISLLEITEEENHASYLLIVLKFFISNKCIDEDQFEDIANLSIKVIKSTNNSSLCITQFSHIIYEISKRTSFDDIYQATVAFVKELFSNEDNPKLIIDAINFIKNLDELGLIFLQKPEMIDFWESTPNLIADPTSNKEITSAIIKMISAFCIKIPSNNNELFPYMQKLISPFLESAKNRLIAEMEEPSGLRDNLAVFISILGGSVIGDDFPFADFMLLILSAIPLRYDFTLCSELYQFISGIYPFVIAQDEQLNNLYIQRLVDLFSQPFNNVVTMKIDSYVLNSMQTSLSKALLKEDENDYNDDVENNDNEQLSARVLEVLDGDQEKLAMFKQTYSRIHDYCIMNNQLS